MKHSENEKRINRRVFKNKINETEHEPPRTKDHLQGENEAQRRELK